MRGSRQQAAGAASTVDSGANHEGMELVRRTADVPLPSRSRGGSAVVREDWRRSSPWRYRAGEPLAQRGWRRLPAQSGRSGRRPCSSCRTGRRRDLRPLGRQRKVHHRLVCRRHGCVPLRDHASRRPCSRAPRRHDGPRLPLATMRWRQARLGASGRTTSWSPPHSRASADTMPGAKAKQCANGGTWTWSVSQGYCQFKDV